MLFTFMTALNVGVICGIVGYLYGKWVLAHRIRHIINGKCKITLSENTIKQIREVVDEAA